ncbi:hypothetical protein [Streptomyces sp. NPDC091268]|uniref:hypothetical protein n=1 Tax=Streptomyces sp. NPDC091268 TaxID=3365979 RepID=UPI00380D6A9E
MPSPTGTCAALALAAAASLTLTAPPAGGADPAPPVGAAPDRAAAVRAAHTASLQLAAAYRATGAYQNQHTAEAAGYLPDRYCVPGRPGAGGLGYPHFNHAHDNSRDPARPSALIYTDDARGNRRLAALEWVSTGRERPPDMFGAAFNGPIPGKFPGQPDHYTLRVWLWKENPSGRFALYNPDVRCRPGTTRPA